MNFLLLEDPGIVGARLHNVNCSEANRSSTSNSACVADDMDEGWRGWRGATSGNPATDLVRLHVPKTHAYDNYTSGQPRNADGTPAFIRPNALLIDQWKLKADAVHPCIRVLTVNSDNIDPPSALAADGWWVGGVGSSSKGDLTRNQTASVVFRYRNDPHITPGRESIDGYNPFAEGG
jgi:hypothetical protein